MAEFPFFPLYTDAYLVDTNEVGLTTLEHGAYLLLLMTMWRNGGYLPNDDAKLARVTKLTTAQWIKVRTVLDEFLRVDGDRITQGRLLDELEKSRGRSRQAADNARAKYRKNNEPPSAAGEPKGSGSSATRTTTTTTTTDRADALSSDLAEALAYWNGFAAAHGLPLAQKFTGSRKARMAARLHDVGGLVGWRHAIDLIGESDFLLGRTAQNFRAGLDFVLQEGSFVKLVEGNYRTNKRAPSAAMEALRKIREEQ